MKRLLLLLVIISQTALAAEVDRKGLDFFESKIRPMLVKHCYQCHSAKATAAKTLKGGLQLDTRDGILTGGESGPALVAGKPDESLLISALNHADFKMPPKGKLADGVIADFVKWVEMGAPDPRDGKAIAAKEIDIEAGKQFWSFQPIKTITPPNAKDMAWVKTPIDQFIRASQESKNVQPNGIASARTLVRRAFYDLTGLPPAPEELDQWTKRLTESVDRQGYTELIDHLLASEHYGERWARHWLDLVRFAESNGYAFDKDRANAFQYRDFIIRALNSDMPYDQFVRLQVAGDLLANTNAKTNAEAQTAVDAIAATGFLVAGPFTTQQTQKERERSRYEQLDDMVNTLGTSLLGLTVGCSRCHSHKYDPLPQHDYYRLVSCFSEVGFSDTGVNMQPEAFTKQKADFDAAHAPIAAALAAFEKDQLAGRLNDFLAKQGEEKPAPSLGVWQHIGPFGAENFDRAHDTAFSPETEIDLKKTYQDGKLKWTAQPKWEDGNAQTLSGDNSANYVFREINSPVARQLALSLGSDDSIKVWVNGKEVLNNKISRGVAPDQEKITIALKEGRNELLMKISNGGGGHGFYFKSALSAIPPAVAAILKMPQDKWNDAQRKQVTDWYKPLDAEWLKLNKAVADHKAKEPKPAMTNMYAAKVKGSTYNFGADTYNVYFLRRGNPDNKQELATPGVLQVLSNSQSPEERWFKNTEAQKPPRIALADWLTDTQQGAGDLLARVIVNRLWHHHFGTGIVYTTSDFGTRGERPTHPELLDWLAGELIKNGWKLKPIHRLMMTSAVYMQAGQDTETGKKNDPENLLFWRQQPRRLEAEIIRDALLAVSGTLDRKMFGKGSLDEKMTRRSVYLTVKRSRLIPMLQLFDAPDTMQGIGQRERSTVAPQALAMLNSPIIRDWASKLATRVKPNNETTLTTAIDQAYLTTLSRPPADEERERMLAFIEKQKAARGTAANAEQLALRDFCHLLLCMNEFVYVD